MKQKQKILLSIGLGVVILLNVLLLGWLLADLFSGPNGPEETVAATDSGEETTGEETTGTEETSTQEVTTEEPTPEETTPEETIGERIEKEIPFAEIEKNVIRTFKWGGRINELGYHESVSQTYYPSDFVVKGNDICVDDNANGRIVLNGKEIGRSSADSLDLDILDGWITIWNPWEYKLVIYRKDSEVEINFDLSTELEGHKEISRFLEIGGSYNVWAEKTSGNKEAIYRYDWIENKVKIVAIQETSTPTVSVEHKFLWVMGTHEDKTYYYYLNLDENKYILNVEMLNWRVYTEIDYSGYRAAPLFYLSSDGHLYIMEMFEDRVEVSEIKLTPEMAE